ncbi:ABC transporter permease [Ferrimicrobium sp.]|uniref:ABC transporter permease n=1 Tax=Ferrimicrobium sp. TaxID=2926050 RepID=UPI0026381ED5|nr:ABC transporter permease [Ferrimicrobium sp.]
MRFLLRRLGFYLIALFVAITVNFFIPRLMPGNVVENLMSKYPNLKPSAQRALDVLLGVGHQGSLLHQYVLYLGQLAHGNFGIDPLQFPTPVIDIIRAALPWTIVLVGTATVISWLLGTGLGILAAWRRGGRLDQLLPALSFLQATPYFFLALVLVWLLALHFHLFPAQQGFSNGLTIGFNWAFISSAVVHSILPALTIVLTSAAGWMLQMRNVMVATMGEDYVLAAQAKGLSKRRVIFTYGARNAILPSISGFALALGFVVSGTLLMEIVFNYPGIGTQLYNAVTSDDYPLTQAIFLIISVAVLLANIGADVIYVILDPRVRRRGVE